MKMPINKRQNMSIWTLKKVIWRCKKREKIRHFTSLLQTAMELLRSMKTKFQRKSICLDWVLSGMTLMMMITKTLRIKIMWAWMKICRIWCIWLMRVLDLWIHQIQIVFKTLFNKWKTWNQREIIVMKIMMTRMKQLSMKKLNNSINWIKVLIKKMTLKIKTYITLMMPIWMKTLILIISLIHITWKTWMILIYMPGTMVQN